MSTATENCRLPTWAKPDRPISAQRPPLWLTGAIVAMIVQQVFASQWTPNRQPPGPARDDVELAENALPTVEV